MSNTKRVLITGCNGFISRYLIEELSNEEIRIFGVDIAVKNTKSGENIQLLEVDIAEENNIAKIKEILKSSKTDELYIVHLAGLTDAAKCHDHPELSARLNIGTLKNIAGLTADFNVKKIIFASTSLVYGTKYKESISEDFSPCPENTYAKDKLEAENYLLTHYPCGVALRLANVYGIGMNKNTVVATVLEQLGNNYLKLKEYESIRDFIYIKDVVGAFKACLFKECGFKIYNVSTAKDTSIYELAKTAAKVLHKEKIVPALKTNPREAGSLVLSNTRIRKDLGVKFNYSLEAGLKDMLNAH